jgi:hypothetical protein
LCRTAALAAAALLGCLAAAVAAPPPAPGTGAAESFESFRLIGNLNIFNSSRVGWTADSQRPRMDIISLVGTMEFAKQRLAFFDGTEGGFRKVLHEGDTIADVTVTRIDAGGVRLTRDSALISLAMGQQLRRPPGGAWSVGAVPEGGQLQPDSAAPAIPPGASDVLKRLMEQRQNQLKQ